MQTLPSLHSGFSQHWGGVVVVVEPNVVVVVDAEETVVVVGASVTVVVGAGVDEVVVGTRRHELSHAAPARATQSSSQIVSQQYGSSAQTVSTQGLHAVLSGLPGEHSSCAQGSQSSPQTSLTSATQLSVQRDEQHSGSTRQTAETQAPKSLGSGSPVTQGS